jgi:hypothetical protein
MTPAELQDVVTHLSAPVLRKRSDEAYGHNAIDEGVRGVDVNGLELF